MFKIFSPHVKPHNWTARSQCAQEILHTFLEVWVNLTSVIFWHAAQSEQDGGGGKYLADNHHLRTRQSRCQVCKHGLLLMQASDDADRRAMMHQPVRTRSQLKHAPRKFRM